MSSARSAGILYLLVAITASFSLMYVPAAIVVAGDAAATARNINAADLTYRLGILSGLVSNILFLLLGLSLYDLLKDVHRKHARLMLALVALAAGVGVVNHLNEIAPLLLLSGADFLSVFTKPQLEALALGALRLHNAGLHLASAFWGLWLFPFAVLVIRSGFVPKILGVLLMIAGAGYLMSCFTYIVLPAHLPVVSRVTLVLATGELPIIVWLLMKGQSIQPMAAQRPI